MEVMLSGIHGEERIEVPVIVDVKRWLPLWLLARSLQEVFLFLLKNLVSLTQQATTDLECRLQHDVLRQVKCAVSRIAEFSKHWLQLER